FTKMRPTIDLPRALLRGRFMQAAARIEWVGVPVDAELHHQLVKHWPFIQEQLIHRVDQGFRVFDGLVFKQDRFANYLEAQGIPWPRTTTGRLALDDESFKERARTYPQLEPLRQLRNSLSQLRLSDLSIGRDGRNRVLLSAFGARTGRNT